MHSWPHPQVSDCFRQSGPILQTGGHGHRARRGFRARRVPVNRSASSRTGPQRIHVQQFLIIFIRQDRIQAGFNVKSILYCEQTKENAKYATQLTQGLIEINIIHMDARWRYGSIRTSLSIKDAYRSSNGTARPSINFSHEFTARRSHIAKGNLKIFAHRMLTQKTGQEVTDPYHRLYTVLWYLNFIGYIKDSTVLKKGNHATRNGHVRRRWVPGHTEDGRAKACHAACDLRKLHERSILRHPVPAHRLRTCRSITSSLKDL